MPTRSARRAAPRRGIDESWYGDGSGRGAESSWYATAEPERAAHPRRGNDSGRGARRRAAENCWCGNAEPERGAHPRRAACTDGAASRGRADADRRRGSCAPELGQYRIGRSGRRATRSGIGAQPVSKNPWVREAA